MKGARYSLWKNPENLSENQQIKLAWIAATDPKLYRAYLLKEGLRTIFAMPYHDAVQALEKWIGWARRCRVPAFVKLQKSIVKHQATILAAIKHNLSNGLRPLSRASCPGSPLARQTPRSSPGSRLVTGRGGRPRTRSSPRCERVASGRGRRLGNGRGARRA